ncbi:MAG: TIM barrel protein [FCB group bacterium]|jgi:hydroxypyruvate isomerase|nr:TIM barrel protein [FCB group bacterium]
MIQLDVCIEAVFTSSPVEERIKQVARCGYDCIELWLHDATFDGAGLNTAQPKDPASLRQACAEYGVTINNLVVNPPDDGTFGGTPSNSATHAKYLERVEEVIQFAKSVNCTKAITCSGDLQPSLSRPQMRANVEKALAAATAIAEKHDFTLLLEPLNTHVDHKGYYLDSSAEAAELVRAIDSPNFRLLFDVYHMQIMEGNIIDSIRKHVDVIGHFHSAGVPGRGEHDRGELNYPEIIKAIEDTGYQGVFGLEYFPKLADHAESLTRVRRHLLQL